MLILTVARHSWEGDVKIDCKFFSPRLIDENRRLDMNASIIQKLKQGEREDDEHGEHSDCDRSKASDDHMYEWVLRSIILRDTREDSDEYAGRVTAEEGC